jgi:hypothetical protein
MEQQLRKMARRLNASVSPTLAIATGVIALGAGIWVGALSRSLF